MAQYNRNQRGSTRSSNQDWNQRNEQHGRYDEDQNYRSSQNRQQYNSMEMDDAQNSGWQNRHQREGYDSGNSNTGRYGRHYESDFNSGNYGSDRGYGYSSHYPGSGYEGSSGYEGRSGRSSRNLYDRVYEGMNRGDYSNSGTRLGAGNYGNYEDRGRTYGGYSGSNYGGNYFGGRSGNENRDREERTWWDRTTDEVSSWFGDDDAERRRDRDRQMSGQYKGKGPKNYSRSDDRIKEDVNDRLSDDPYIDATEIDVTVSNAEVTLTGTVDHRSTKRRAEDIAEAVSGVRNVENRIRVGQISDVRSPEKDPGTTSSQSTSAVPGSERTRRKDYVTG